MRRGKVRTIIWALAGTALAAMIQTGCNVWCDPDNQHCDRPEPTPTTAPAIASPVASLQFCDLEEHIAGAQYWAMMARWTGPTTAEITHVKRSTAQLPDADEDNLTRQAVRLWAITPGGPEPQSTEAIQRATAPPGSWVRVITQDETGPGEMAVVMRNHHDWDIATILALGGAVRAARDAPECMWRMTGQDRPEPSAKAEAKGAENYAAASTNTRTTAAERNTEPTLTPLLETVKETTEQQVEPKAGDAGVASPPAPTPTTSPRPTTETNPTPTPQPTPDLRAYASPPAEAAAAVAQHRNANLAGCQSAPDGTKARQWVLLGEAEGIRKGRPAFAVHHQEAVELADGMCYELAAKPLGTEEWQICGDNPYATSCDARRGYDSWKTTVPVFRYIPHTLRPIGRAWER